MCLCVCVCVFVVCVCVCVCVCACVCKCVCTLTCMYMYIQYMHMSFAYENLASFGLASAVHVYTFSILFGPTHLPPSSPFPQGAHYMSRAMFSAKDALLPPVTSPYQDSGRPSLESLCKYMYMYMYMRIWQICVWAKRCTIQSIGQFRTYK